MKDSIVVVSTDQLRMLVREELEHALAKVVPHDGPNEVLSREQAAALIGVTTRTIPRLVKEKGLPTLRRVGKLWRFSRSDVMAWLAKKSA